MAKKIGPDDLSRFAMHGPHEYGPSLAQMADKWYVHVSELAHAEGEIARLTAELAAAQERCEQCVREASESRQENQRLMEALRERHD